MHVFLLGVSHRTAPVDLRERLDFSSRDLGAAVEALALRPSAAESVVLSTCNRSEIYVASDDPARAREEVDRIPERVPQPAASRRSCRTCSRTTTRPRPAPVPRGRRTRFARRRRAADPRPGEGRLPGGRGTSLRRPGAEQAVPLVVRRRQARADGNGARRRRGVGQLRRRRARAQDLRPPRWPARARRRRRRDQHADGPAPAQPRASARSSITSRTPAHAEALAAAGQRTQRALGRSGAGASPSPTSS